MKNNICYVLTTLVVVCIVYLSTFWEINMNRNVGKVKYVDSNILFDDLASLDNDTVDEIEANEEVVEEVNEQIVENEIIYGRMSGYGPDCVGCTGYLAYNSVYVGDGTIYYNDSEYGQVRIVAGDRKYEFGTIVRINDSMLVIVLDRGGAIGIGKSFLFDLLYPSEKIANDNGILKDAKFEILRNGF